MRGWCSISVRLIYADVVCREEYLFVYSVYVLEVCRGFLALYAANTIRHRPVTDSLTSIRPWYGKICF